MTSGTTSPAQLGSDSSRTRATAASPVAAKVLYTYGDLLHAARHNADVNKNGATAVAHVMAALGRGESDPLGDDFDGAYDATYSAVATMLYDKGRSKATVKSALSVLHRVRDVARRPVVPLAYGNTLGDRLGELQERLGLTMYRELASYAGVTVAQLKGCRTRYGVSAPVMAKLAALEAKAGLPDGYLTGVVGITDIPGRSPTASPVRTEPAAVAVRSPFGQRLGELVKKSGRGPVQVARDVDVKFAVLHGWILSKWMPASPDVVARLEEVLHAKQGELLTLWQPTTKTPDAAYCFTLPTRVQRQWDALERYKTQRPDATDDCKHSPRVPLPEDARWRVVTTHARANRKGKRIERCAAADKMRRYASLYLGYLVRPRDMPPTVLRGVTIEAAPGGRGHDVGDVDLLWLASKDLLQGYTDFMRARQRYFGRPDRLTDGIVADLTQVVSLLRRDTGFLWRAPSYAFDLARAPWHLVPPGQRPKKKATVAARYAAWRAHCETVREELVAWLKAVAPPRKRRRPPNARVARVLAQDEPLQALDLLVERLEAHQAAHGRGMSPGRRAALAGDIVLCECLRACIPLRRRNWAELTYSPSGGGTLRRENFTAPDGRPDHRYLIHYDDPDQQLKAHSRSELPDYTVELPDALTPKIDVFLEEHRPHLADAATCDFVFRPQVVHGTKQKARTPGQPWDHINEHFRVITQRHVPELFPQGIRTHAVRDIVATHILNVTGSVDLASIALWNGAKQINERYGQTTARTRTGHVQHALHDWRDKRDGTGRDVKGTAA